MRKPQVMRCDTARPAPSEDRTMIRRLEERLVLATLTGTGIACVVLTALFTMAVVGKAF